MRVLLVLIGTLHVDLVARGIIGIHIIAIHIEIGIAIAGSVRIVDWAEPGRRCRHIECIWIFVLVGSAGISDDATAAAGNAGAAAVRQCIDDIRAAIDERQAVELVAVVLIERSLGIGKEVEFLIDTQRRVEHIAGRVHHIEVAAAIEVGHIEVHRHQRHRLPYPERRQGAKHRRKREALHGRRSLVALPSAQEAAVIEHVLGQRIQCPEIALARIARLAWYLYKAVVQAEIVPYRVLPSGKLILIVWKTARISNGLIYSACEYPKMFCHVLHR